MNIMHFIVIDDSLKSKRMVSSNRYHHTLNGEVYIQPETPVPVIQKGKGCIGIGMVSELRITASSTTIIFEVRETTESNMEAYYALYRNQISVTPSSDSYDESDVIIPGAIRSVSGNGSDYKPSKGSNKDIYGEPRRKNRSILDIADDDEEYHW